MRKKIYFVLLFVFFYPLVHNAQVQNVIVETYYISNTNDATDTINGPDRALPAGSKTYRVYLKLKPGSRLKKIFGDSNHLLKISSTENFYNNIDRPATYFGYHINKSWFPNNPTLALDSWLTLGLAERNHSGVLKINDTNGSFIGGTNNFGGTAEVPEGLLNNNIIPGISLATADGYMPQSLTTVWSDAGFRDNLIGGPDTTVFGSSKIGSSFVSDVAFLQASTGVSGASDNQVIVAQLTTLGEISFELNVVLIEQDGANEKDVWYVAKLAPGEINNATLKVSPFLTYPPLCGCTDPNYLEYNPAYGCNVSDSCLTRIVFGCMDPMACNFKPDANFNIPELCCYPGYCNDRDIALVCPVLSTKKILLYPNPARDVVTLEISSLIDDEETRYAVYDSFGRLMFEKNISVSSGTSTISIDVSGWSKGVYMFRLYSGENSESRTFLKD